MQVFAISKLCYVAWFMFLFFLSPTQHCNAYFYADNTMLRAIGPTANQAFFRLQSAFNDLQALAI